VDAAPQVYQVALYLEINATWLLRTELQRVICMSQCALGAPAFCSLCSAGKLHSPTTYHHIVRDLPSLHPDTWDIMTPAITPRHSLGYDNRQPARAAPSHMCLCGHVSLSAFDLTCHILTATNDVVHGTPPDRRNRIGSAGILVCVDTDTSFGLLVFVSPRPVPNMITLQNLKASPSMKCL
jgi:hypothetical protein